MDSRINVFDMLGVEEGDCHVIRTAGGRIQDGSLVSCSFFLSSSFRVG